jgi:hypothetical protein
VANAIGSSPLLRRHNLTSGVSFCRTVALPPAHQRPSEESEATRGTDCRRPDRSSLRRLPWATMRHAIGRAVVAKADEMLDVIELMPVRAHVATRGRRGVTLDSFWQKDRVD